MKNGIKYEFAAVPRLWPFSPSSGCPFVPMPQEMADEIREHLKFQEEGWGRMKATVRIGNSQWDTSIWFDTKHGTYILPIKAAIRKKENIGLDKQVDVCIWI